MVHESSFTAAIRDLTAVRKMGYVLIDETDATVTEDKDPAHNKVVTEAQGTLLASAAGQGCPIVIVRMLMMPLDILKATAMPPPPDRVEHAFKQAAVKLPAAKVSFVMKSEAYPFGNSHPPLEEELQKCRVRNFVYMGFHTNACVRAAAVGPRGSETQLGAADKFDHSIWTCRCVLRGDQGNADWKDHPKVNFFTTL